ncbi:hypothetical protein M0802_000389 [Mischocyttarus mexicanus]|nr:hypothetical protein M0802_000389 [Mischocyttarus mexicanus]
MDEFIFACGGWRTLTTVRRHPVTTSIFSRHRSWSQNKKSESELHELSLLGKARSIRERDTQVFKQALSREVSPYLRAREINVYGFLGVCTFLVYGLDSQRDEHSGVGVGDDGGGGGGGGGSFEIAIII